MASTPLFIIPDFFCIFQKNLAMATLGLEEMGKFRWEGREKENAKKNLVFHFGGGHHASFPQ